MKKFIEFDGDIFNIEEISAVQYLEDDGCLTIFLKNCESNFEYSEIEPEEFEKLRFELLNQK